jgi:DNA polymerase-3 subunit beta
MKLTIPIITLVAARKLLTRIRFERLTLPVLNHVLVTIDNAGLTLAVTDLDHWLETRVQATIEPFAPGQFLIPAEAFKAATRGDRKSSAHFVFESTADGTTLTLTTSCGGMSVNTVYHPEPADEFPARPSVDGRIATLPKETFAALATVAVCASTDATRYVLNGVWFSTDNGGILIATDGRRLAGAPARFSGREFVLPSTAVNVLAHPDFLARDAAIQQPDDPEKSHVQFRSGPHTLIARLIEGNYPGYRHVIPGYLPESVTIPEPHRPAVISWLRTLRGRLNSVRLTWEKPGHLTLTHRDYDTIGATISVPVTIEGKPPVIAFDPGYLADALEIGATLRLVDSLNPGMATDSSGNFCLIMNQRVDPESVTEDAASKTPVPVSAIAA